MEYNYEGLLDQGFHSLCEALLIREYSSFKCFPIPVADGGRDAMVGSHASKELIVFQVKYARNPAKIEDATGWAISAINGELETIQRLSARGIKQYILMTNVSGTSHSNMGSIDKVQEYIDSNLPCDGQCLWRDDLDRRLDSSHDLRLRYPSLMISGADTAADDNQTALDDEQANLLLRVYIPSERLYAAEADRLLSLFRDWLMKSRGHGVRQTGHRTASGQMYEFFADMSVAKIDLREEFNNFSNFLTLCSVDPSAAADMLVPMGLGRTTSANFVDRIGREVRRLQIDLAHERERRILTIRHALEEELVDNGVELRAVPSTQINALIETLVPGPSASDSLTLLAAPQSNQAAPPIALTFNQQFINAMESTIIQNVRGTVHLGPRAQELLALIDRFGGQEAPLLEAAVHELEDADARPADRSAAKRRLKKFLSQVAGMVQEVGLDLLEKYLESKTGLK